MRTALPALLLLSILGSAGAAEAGTVLVVGFTAQGKLPAPMADAPKRLGDDMAEVARSSGAEVNQATRDDVMALAGCGSDASDDCLKSSIGALGVESIVVGEVSSDPSGVQVKLEIISASEEPRSTTLTLPGASADAVEPAFKTQATAFWSGTPPPATAAPAPAPASTPAVDFQSHGQSHFAFGRVKPTSWAIAGGGAGVLLIGGLFMLAAKDKQHEIDSAPTDTVDDLNHLKDLEDTGRRDAHLGTALAVIGGAAVVVGAILVIKQGTSPDEEAQVSVAPTATASAGGRGGLGLGLVLTVRGDP